jgi:hypothetical protein
MPLPSIPRPEPSVNRHPPLLDGSVTWKIEHDLVNNAVAVTTGSDAVMAMPSGLKVRSWKADARASVAAERPDAARIDAQTTIQLDMPATGEVEVETETTIFRDRLLATSRITINGRLFFAREWKK